MGFWSSFFGAGAAHVYNEMKKEEKETQKWNDNLHMTMNYEEEFSNYLKSIGSNAVYISEVDESAASVRNQIDRYKRKIKEFLNLGGEGKYIYDVEELDEYIDVMKYLKSVGCIDRQDEFLGLDLCFAKDTIEREQEEQALQRESEIIEIIGTDINSLSGIEFEKVCQQLVEKMGFETETTKASGDGGIDLIAYNHQPLLSGKYIIQCKRYSGSVGEPIIRDLYGVITAERANKGILITTGYFTKSAIAFAEDKPIELIAGKEVQELLIKYNIGIVKDDDFFYEMLCTIGIKDYENVCMQYIENQGYIVTDILERNEKSIFIKASEKSKNIIFACFQESKDMVDDELLHNISSKENVESIEKIIVIGVENSVSIADRKVETISCEQFLDALKNQGIIDDEGINLKIGLIPPDKKAILNDVYDYMKEKYLENKNEINAQLAFMEVLSETLSNAWFRNEDEYFIKELLDEYFDVEKELVVININIQYMLLFVRANLLCLVGEVKETIKLYRKLLEWEMLTNSIVYENGLEDMYLAVVYNLYQFLLIENCNKEAEEIYQKHNKIIQYGLDSCMEQVEYGVDTNDEKFRREWQRAYDIISGGKIGEIYVSSGLDGYVISAIHASNGYRSMIIENFKNIEDIGSKESVYLDVWIDVVDLEQREDGYYVKKKDGMKKWNLH